MDDHSNLPDQRRAQVSGASLIEADMSEVFWIGRPDIEILVKKALRCVGMRVHHDGRVIELKAGELFYIPPVPHDSWVVGDKPYVSLHFLGAGEYAVR